MLKKTILGVALVAGAAALLGGKRSASTQGGPATRWGWQAEHHSQTTASYLRAGTRILVLGANFGGLATALSLDRRLGGRRDVSVLVVDRDNSQLFSPLLWLVAEGRANVSDVVVPVRTFQHGRSFHVLHADVLDIDLDKREVLTSDGVRPYDALVIALGSVTAMPDLPGLRQYAHEFHTSADALELRNHLIDAIEHAHQSEDRTERQACLTFVVGGGGDTGIELAATIHSYIVNGLFTDYPWLNDAPVRIVLVGRDERLVPMSTPSTSATVRQVLEAEGIEVHTGVSITGVTERAVQTSQGDIPSHTLFWAAGITAPERVRALPVEHARNGAVMVDDHLRVKGHPEVYVVGDAAWAYDSQSGAPIPPTAQAAEHEGAYVGRAIAAGLADKEAPPFRFTTLGHLALLGNHTGVAEIGPLTFTGVPAWLLWHGYYLFRIPAWRNRVYLLTHLLLSAVLGRDTTQIRLGRDDQEEVTGRPDEKREAPA